MVAISAVHQQDILTEAAFCRKGHRVHNAKQALCIQNTKLSPKKYNALKYTKFLLKLQNPEIKVAY